MGKELAQFLMDENYIPESLTLGGFSLGAHVAGYAGNILNGTIKAIYGLDPAGPFVNGNSAYLLNSKDAKNVQSIKTTNWFGTNKVIAHQNFYPNGGTSPQPGCTIFEKFFTLGCSHHLSHELFRYSIPWYHYLDFKKCSPKGTQAIFAEENEIARFGFHVDKR